MDDHAFREAATASIEDSTLLASDQLFLVNILWPLSRASPPN